jgi:hypothetical protein
MRKTYIDDICDKCRIYPKDSNYILCVKCKNEWLAYGMKLQDKYKGKPLDKNEFEDWFKHTPKPFIFR